VGWWFSIAVKQKLLYKASKLPVAFRSSTMWTNIRQWLARPYFGTGAGLALVKRTIEAHGGRIWIESEGQGSGSVFCFTLLIKE
jgi:signal transduction histidine kinase